jgi:chemotaxis protein CheC
MTDTTPADLTGDQRDALQEIANIGMGQAGASIAKIWGEFVQLSVPRIAHLDRQNIPAMLSRFVGDETVNAVRQAFHGQFRGEVIVVFSAGRGDQLAALMGYEEADSVEEQELLLDVANILVGACLGGIAETLEADIGFSAPSVMGLDIPPAQLIHPDELVTGRALFLEVRFTLEKKSFTSHLVVLMPADEMGVLGVALDKFLSAI